MTSKHIDQQELSKFYEITFDLNHIGSYCSSFNITRAIVFDWTLVNRSSLPHILSHGLLLELDEFCVKEKLSNDYLFGFLQNILPDVFDSSNKLKSALNKLRSQKKTLNKSKHRNPEKFAEFMDSLF